MQRIEKLPVVGCRPATLHRLAAVLTDNPAALIVELIHDTSQCATTQPPDQTAPNARPEPRAQRTSPLPAPPDPAGHPRYDNAAARELLARTSDLPGSKNDLITLLTEYRHALHALATQPASTSTADASQPEGWGLLTGHHRGPQLGR